MADSKADKIKKLDLELKQVTRTDSLLNSNQVQKIFNSTPKNYQYDRPAKGGGNWTYVKSSYVRKVLDSVFGFNWDFEIETSLSEAFEVAKMTGYCVVKGTITARVKSDGQWIELRKTQFGRSEVKFLTEDAKGDDGKIIYEVYFDKYTQKEKKRALKTRKIDPFTKMPVPLDFGNDMKAAVSDALKKCASMFGIAADIYEKEEFVEIHLTDSDDHSEKAKGVKNQVEKAKEQLKKEGAEVTE